jgi:hypothetical protein
MIEKLEYEKLAEENAIWQRCIILAFDKINEIIEKLNEMEEVK